jgi:polyhydroxybutyrate depolymerase
LCLIVGCQLAKASAQDTEVSVPFGGVMRSYLLHPPAGYNAAVVYPLLLVEAGVGGNGKVMAQTTGFDAIADANGFFVAYPNPNGPQWSLSGPNNDIEFNELIVADLEASYTINPSRLYIAGYAYGGRLATTYACSQAPGTFAAGVAVVSNDMNTDDEAVCNAAPPPPTVFMLFHGTADPESPYDGGLSPGGRTDNLSAAATAAYWVNVDGCSDDSFADTLPDLLSDGTVTTDDEIVWPECGGGVQVIFYTINGGGHTWPASLKMVQKTTGRNGPTSLDLHASQLIWSGLSPFAADVGFARHGM